MRSLFMIGVIYRKSSYMTAVNDHSKQPSFFVVNDWGTAVYDRARSTWVFKIDLLKNVSKLLNTPVPESKNLIELSFDPKHSSLKYDKRDSAIS